METTWTNVQAKVSFVRLWSPRKCSIKSRLAVRIRCTRGINQQLSFRTSSKEFWTITSEMYPTFWNVWLTKSNKIRVLFWWFRIKNLTIKCSNVNTSERIADSYLFILQDTKEHIYVEIAPSFGIILSLFDLFEFPSINSILSWQRRQKTRNENCTNLASSKV